MCPNESVYAHLLKGKGTVWLCAFVPEPALPCWTAALLAAVGWALLLLGSCLYGAWTACSFVGCPVASRPRRALYTTACKQAALKKAWAECTHTLVAPCDSIPYKHLEATPDTRPPPPSPPS